MLEAYEMDHHLSGKFRLIVRRASRTIHNNPHYTGRVLFAVSEL